MPDHPHPYRLVYNEAFQRTELQYHFDSIPPSTVSWITDEAVSDSPIGLRWWLHKVALRLQVIGQEVIWVEHPQGADFGSEPLATPVVKYSGTTYFLTKEAHEALTWTGLPSADGSA